MSSPNLPPNNTEGSSGSLIRVLNSVDSADQKRLTETLDALDRVVRRLAEDYRTAVQELNRRTEAILALNCVLEETEEKKAILEAQLNGVEESLRAPKRPRLSAPEPTVWMDLFPKMEMGSEHRNFTSAFFKLHGLNGGDSAKNWRGINARVLPADKVEDFRRLFTERFLTPAPENDLPTTQAATAVTEPLGIPAGPALAPTVPTSMPTVSFVSTIPTISNRAVTRPPPTSHQVHVPHPAYGLQGPHGPPGSHGTHLFSGPTAPSGHPVGPPGSGPSAPILSTCATARVVRQ